MHIKEACYFYFDSSATRIRCDGRGLRYSFPSDKFRLRHFSGQLVVFLLSQEVTGELLSWQEPNIAQD